MSSNENKRFFKLVSSEFSEYLNANFGINDEFIRNKLRNKTNDNLFFTLMIIAIEPNISAENIGKILGVSSRTIENYISEMKNENIILRKDSKKTGSWEIVGIEN